MAHGRLYLVPSGLGGEGVVSLVPPATVEVAHRLTHFIAENPKTARAFLKAIGHPRPLREITIATLDEHTPPARVPGLMRPLEAGTDCGLISEAGCPAIADPGAPLVRAAHAAAIEVIPLVGPSALLLAVMACGMSGQRFTFHGYLPIDREERAARLMQVESESGRNQATQLFIEAPYRNQALLEALLETCRPDTLLCLATDLTLPTQRIETRTMGAWKTGRPPIDRRPTVFLLYRESA